MTDEEILAQFKRGGEVPPGTTFWDFLDRQIDRLPGWPSERQFVTCLIFALAWTLLHMAVANGDLWNVELFKIILQAVIIGAIIGAIVAFHFAASKHDAAPQPVPTKIVNSELEPVPVERTPSTTVGRSKGKRP